MRGWSVGDSSPDSSLVVTLYKSLGIFFRRIS